MQAVRFGWFLSPGPAPSPPALPRTLQVVAQQPDVLPAIAEHFDSIWVPDHFFGFDDPTEPWAEAWTTLTWLAARYPQVHVGPIVLGVGYRNPALLAKMAATLQALSGGRFIMGIGAGWREADYVAYGYPFPAAAQRIAELDEAVQIMRRMWTSPAPSFDGRYFQIKEAYCEPRLDPIPPIMIGGSGPKLLLPLAGRQADIWDRYHAGSPAEIDRAAYQEKRDILRRAAAEAGRDPDSITQSYSIEHAPRPETPDDEATWRGSLRALMDLGVRQFIVGFNQGPTVEQVHRFAAEVLGPLRQG